MLVADLLDILERLAPARLAQAWDNSGLLVGDEAAPVARVLSALDLTGPVLEEAAAGAFDMVLTHHPLLFKPVRSLVESRPQERLLRGLVSEGISLVACHTNLDAASGGIADMVAEGLGMRRVTSLQPAPSGWVKLVGFVPADSLEQVSAAVFAAGAGGIGPYAECAFACEGTGWFTPGKRSAPVVGAVGEQVRTAEVRWETIAPRERLADCIRAYVEAHPYEVPAFDVYGVEDVSANLGIGRVGELPRETTVVGLAAHAREVFELSTVSWSGEGKRLVRRVGVLPGSGRGLLEQAVGRCDALITGDLSYHDAYEADSGSVALIDVPHGELEWWAFRRWCDRLRHELEPEGVEIVTSQRWTNPWECTSNSG